MPEEFQLPSMVLSQLWIWLFRPIPRIHAPVSESNVIDILNNSRFSCREFNVIRPSHKKFLAYVGNKGNYAEGDVDFTPDEIQFRYSDSKVSITNYRILLTSI